MKRAIVAVCAAGIVAASCGSSYNGFAVKDQLFIKTSGSGNVSKLILTDVPMTCNLLLVQMKPAGAVNELTFVIPNLGVGKYDVVPQSTSGLMGNQVNVQYRALKDCASKGGGFASKGTFELTRADARWAGSYEITFDSGFIKEDGTYGSGTMKGSFDAPECMAGGLATTSLCN